MKILHLCNKLPFPGRDGSSIAMESLVRLEQDLGHDVHVIALNTDKHYINQPKAPLGVQLTSIDVSIKPTLWNYLSSKRKRWSYFASRFYHSKAAQAISEAAENCDLVVIDSLFMAVYLDHLEKPTVIRAHNIEHMLWDDTLVHMPWWKRLLLSTEIKRLKAWEIEVLGNHPVWAITRDDLQVIEKMGGKGFHIPCSIAEGHWDNSGSESSHIYHLGAMDWFPNIEGVRWLVDAVMPHLNSNLEIQVLSKDRPTEFGNLPSQIQWIQERVPDEWFDNQGIFIAPIRSGSGMRIKVLEAMSRGKAIVTTTIGAQGIMANHKEHLMIADEAESFAQSIQLLHNDRSLRIKLGQAAAEHAQKHFRDEVVSNELCSALRL